MQNSAPFSVLSMTCVDTRCFTGSKLAQGKQMTGTTDAVGRSHVDMGTGLLASNTRRIFL